MGIRAIRNLQNSKRKKKENGKITVKNENGKSKKKRIKRAPGKSRNEKITEWKQEENMQSNEMLVEQEKEKKLWKEREKNR